MWGEVTAVEGAAVGQHALAAGDGVLDQRGGSEVGVNPDRKQAVLHESEALTRDCGRLGHTSHAPGGAAEVLGGRPAASKGAGKIGMATARCNRAQRDTVSGCLANV